MITLTTLSPRNFSRQTGVLKSTAPQFGNQAEKPPLFKELTDLQREITETPKERLYIGPEEIKTNADEYTAAIVMLEGRPHRFSQSVFQNGNITVFNLSPVQQGQLPQNIQVIGVRNSESEPYRYMIDISWGVTYANYTDSDSDELIKLALDLGTTLHNKIKS